MTFEIGDKVLTSTGLYMNGAWREKGLKGKVLESPNEYGSLAVKFKGIEEKRFIRPEYLIVREKAKKEEAPGLVRPFEVDTVVELQKDVVTYDRDFDEGDIGVVIEVIPDSNLVVVDFEGDYITLTEEVLATAEEQDEEEPADLDFEPEAVPDLHEVKDNPEVQAALALVLERIEEIKTLLTTKPSHEVYFTINEASFVTEPAAEEEPAPEPVFKKAKEVKIGDLLYTEAGAYDKVDQISTKASGYTSLYGVFGNRIAQIPSGRVVQVLEEV